MAANGVRVVLAEDDVLLREGLASLLERSGFEVVGQAGDAARLLDLVAEQAPDLAVVDIRMPPTHTTEGLEAARRIRQEHPKTGILVLSAHVEVEHAMDLLTGGRGVGYLLKSRVTDVEEFIDTLGRWSTRPWWPSWCRPAAATTPWPPSAVGSARSWP